MVCLFPVTVQKIYIGPVRHLNSGPLDQRAATIKTQCTYNITHYFKCDIHRDCHSPGKNHSSRKCNFPRTCVFLQGSYKMCRRHFFPCTLSLVPAQFPLLIIKLTESFAISIVHACNWGHVVCFSRNTKHSNRWSLYYFSQISAEYLSNSLVKRSRSVEAIYDCTYRKMTPSCDWLL